jgi:hypothetical protein
MYKTTREPPDDINEILYWRILRKVIKPLQYSGRSGKSEGHFTWRTVCISAGILLNIGEKTVSNKSWREKWTYFYAQYTFSGILTFFEQMKQKQSYDYISELTYSTINLLGTTGIEKK